ncbi:hypothetical protein [Jatrophihabitans endophyticus]|uniref:hypothetical protein n=1 Tax=Jatrophihabitans endophyticus TaxID=1206085 RepID=UPI0019FC20D7|nr:hypothetical protein [Jatrophihabitans endophyticus]MBE7187922.1 hypothetical protein [Jatrophihabitans endophyticus]
MSRAPDLVVHVGLGAAGTLLTSAAALLGAELARQGVRCAQAPDVPSVGGAPLLVTAAAPPPPTDPSDAWAFCSLSPDEVGSVIERSGGRRVRILFSPERQDRLLERSYRDAVAGGYAGTFAERYPRAAEPLLDYGPIARALEALPGVADLQVVPLEYVAAGQIAYVGALLDTLECDRPIDLRPLATWRVPREYGPRGMGIALAMAPHLDTDADRQKVAKYVMSRFSVPVGASPRILPGPDRQAIVHAYRPANRKFFADHAPALSTSSYGGRTGLDMLAATLSPVVVQPAAPPAAPRPTARRAVRSVLGRVRRRLLG